MTPHSFVADPARSVARGLPLAEDAALGGLTLPLFLRETAARFGPREALVEHRPDGSILRWSYAELAAQSLRVAKALAAGRLGKGERVGVLMTNRAEFLAAVFGAAMAGGVATPLSTFSTPNELAHLIASSACSVLLFEQRVLKKDFAQMLEALDPALSVGVPNHLESTAFPFLRRVVVLDGEAYGAVEGWEGFLASGDDLQARYIEARAAAVTPADPGVLFFSSGSTNRPKGILSAHRGVAIQMWRMAPQQALEDGVRSWTANGFFWSGNFAMVLGATLAAGGALVLQRTFQAEEALDLIAAERASFLFAWPHQWAQLTAATNWRDVDLAAVRHVDPETPIAAHPTIDTAWIEPRHCYGSTETFTLSTGYPANTPRETAANSHGRPFPGVTLKVVDPLSGEVLPLGDRGEIAIKGPTLMLGYIGVPLDETLDEDGFFRTGDGGYLDGEGRLFWEGRLNDIIKTGGANVSPAEIDEVLRTCPGVKVSQTVGVPHATLGEMVVACIVPVPGGEPSEDAVRAFARERLASYKTPRRVLLFSEADLKMTSSAKIKTADLRALAAAKLDAEAESA